MSKLAYIYKQLNKRDFRVLLVLEKYLTQYEYVPIEIIEREARLPPPQLSMSLSKLSKLKIIKRRIGSLTGYRLTYLGYDCLAIRSLVERGVLAALGDRMGVGKESDVYVGLTPAEEKVIVKFLRIGRTSFRQTKRVRDYTRDRPEYGWLLQSKVAAEKEYKALDLLWKASAKVPRPIGRSRHVVVTSYLEGIELYRYKDPMDPEYMLKVILDTLRKAYLEVGIIHGDLSEYNVLVVVDEERGVEEPYIIDWPQYVYREDPQSEYLLRRDVEYIIRFFNRKYRLKNIEVERALSYVRGEINEI